MSPVMFPSYHLKRGSRMQTRSGTSGGSWQAPGVEETELMTHEPMERCSTPFISRAMLIKTTRKDHYTPIRLQNREEPKH